MSPYHIAYYSLGSVICHEHQSTIDPYEVMSVVSLPSRVDESGYDWQSMTDWPYGSFSVIAIEDGGNRASSLTFEIEDY